MYMVGFRLCFHGVRYMCRGRVVCLSRRGIGARDNPVLGARELNPFKPRNINVQ